MKAPIGSRIRSALSSLIAWLRQEKPDTRILEVIRELEEILRKSQRIE
jgi:hypothetical protein